MCTLGFARYQNVCYISIPFQCQGIPGIYDMEGLVTSKKQQARLYEMRAEVYLLNYSQTLQI